jgi:hypothetical protein
VIFEGIAQSVRSDPEMMRFHWRLSWQYRMRVATGQAARFSAQLVRINAAFIDAQTAMQRFAVAFQNAYAS